MSRPGGRRGAVRGELNRLIDRLLHPHFRDYPALILLDGVLHAMVEQDLNVTIRKFVRYNLPKILRYSVGRRSRKR